MQCVNKASVKKNSSKFTFCKQHEIQQVFRSNQSSFISSWHFSSFLVELPGYTLALKVLKTNSRRKYKLTNKIFVKLIWQIFWNVNKQFINTRFLIRIFVRPLIKLLMDFIVVCLHGARGPSAALATSFCHPCQLFFVYFSALWRARWV